MSEWVEAEEKLAIEGITDKRSTMFVAGYIVAGISIVVLLLLFIFRWLLN